MCVIYTVDITYYNFKYMYVIHHLNKKIITFKIELASGGYIYILMFLFSKDIKCIKNDSKEISNIKKEFYFK